MFGTDYRGFAKVFAMSVARRLEWAAEAGIDVPVSRPVELWRAGATTKVHTHPGCTRLPPRARSRSVELDELPLDRSSWCAQCSSTLPAGRLGLQLRAAEVATRLTVLADDPDADPFELDVLAAEARIRMRAAGPLADRLGVLADAAEDRTFEAVRSPAARLRAATCAALGQHAGLLEGHPWYPQFGAHLAPATAERAGKAAFRVLSRHLEDPVADPDPIRSARRAALDAAVRHVAAEAAPDATAAEMGAAVDHWLDQAAVLLEGPHPTVFVRARGDRAAQPAWQVCRPFDPVVDFDRGTLVVSMPTPVVHELRRRQCWIGGHCTISTLAERPATGEQMAAALDMFADEPDCDPAELFDATCLAIAA